FFSSRRRHTRFDCDWSSDVCSSDLVLVPISMPMAPKLTRKSLSSLTTMHCSLGSHFRRISSRRSVSILNEYSSPLARSTRGQDRSEERRVGKGRRGGWAAELVKT